MAKLYFWSLNLTLDFSFVPQQYFVSFLSQIFPNPIKFIRTRVINPG